MTEAISLNTRCHFQTERLAVQSWQNSFVGATGGAGMDKAESDKVDFAKKVIRILTPAVTESLPDGWQGIDTLAQANDWINDRVQESVFLTVQSLASQDVIGFLFLHESPSAASSKLELKIGYLLAESVWGKGLGSELIGGLVNWCEADGDVASIAGGVDPENKASIQVLEKNGFQRSSEGSSKQVVFLERKLST